jgi:hypothetical protein
VGFGERSIFRTGGDGKEHGAERQAVIIAPEAGVRGTATHSLLLRMGISPAELRKQSLIALAWARQVRADAEAARRRAVRCRTIANAAVLSLIARIHAAKAATAARVLRRDDRRLCRFWMSAGIGGRQRVRPLEAPALPRAAWQKPRRDSEDGEHHHHRDGSGEHLDQL